MGFTTPPLPHQRVNAPREHHRTADDPISGCYPLDDHDLSRPEFQQLKGIT